MKKRLFAYILFVSVTFVSVSALAGATHNIPGKNHTAYILPAIRAFNVKEVKHKPFDDSQRAAAFPHYHVINLIGSETSDYLAEPDSNFKVAGYVQQKLQGQKSIKRILKDLLLHLFPSHCFW